LETGLDGDLGSADAMSYFGRSWCIIHSMTRITVDVNDEWLDAARRVLGTGTKVATINEALRAQAVRDQAARILAALDSAAMDFTGSEAAFGYGGGRDLSRLGDEARTGRVA
jgi:Arc/MetJ family transcription regulator